MAYTELPGLHHQRFYNSSGEDTLVVTNPVAYVSAYTRESQLTPGFMSMARNKKNRNIDLPMNPFNFNKVEAKGRNGTRFSQSLNNATGEWWVYQDSGDWGFNLSPPGNDPDNIDALDAKALTKLLGRLHDQSVNVAVFVGEGKQVVNLFGNTIQRITKGGRALSRGDFVGAAQAFGGVTLPPAMRGTAGRNFSRQIQREPRAQYRQAFANAWLELQYGWKPLLSDLYGACEFHANQQWRVPRMRETSVQSNHKEWTDGGSLGPDFDKLIVYSLDTTVRYTIYFSETDAQPLAALGLVNPLAVAWELVPYSFVVDWFIPVGTYLTQLGATSGLQFIKGCKTVFIRANATATYSGKSYNVGDWSYRNYDSTRESVQRISCSRTALGSFPSPAIPRFKSPYSHLHAANAIALLQQVFKR